MRNKTLWIGLVLIAISVMIVGIVVSASGGNLLERLEVSDEQSKTNKSAVIDVTSRKFYGKDATLVTPNGDELLGKYEKSNRVFEKNVGRFGIVYTRQRIIDGVLVDGDYMKYIFDKETKLIEKIERWRDDLPEHLPSVISKEEAELIAKREGRGRIMNTSFAHTRLRFISDPTWYPIKPMPKNPCWIVYFADDEGYNIDVIIISAVEGKISGHGVPFPSSGFSFSGPQDVPNCTGAWTDWYQNAESWFNTMGYPTEAVLYPNEVKVKNNIQSYETAMFYEVAHGHWFTGFKSDCSGDRISPGEMRAWIKDYTKMPFTYIHSCGGMCYTGWPSLSDAFRKGSTEDIATVGYCEMGIRLCNETCWPVAVDWQDAMFNYMSQGWTVKAAFDQACEDYDETSRKLYHRKISRVLTIPII